MAGRHVELCLTWGLAAAACAACAEVRPAPAVLTTAAAVREPSALERGLGAIRAESIAADVAFLADDELAGRDSPSPQQRIAARYLLARLAPLGFEPGTRRGFLHTYELASKRVDPQRSRARWIPAEGEPATGDLVYGVDFGVHPSDGYSGRTTGQVVFAGTGERDELARCELEGRWVLCVEQRFGRRRSLQRAADAAGALGLILVGRTDEQAPDPGGDAAGPANPFADWTRTSQRMRPARPPARERAALAGAWFAGPGFERARGLEVGDVLAERFELEIAGGGALELENVAALWPGSDPALAGELIVLSAHYDHVGINRAGEVMNGADDNASGSAALLALAEALAAHGSLARSVLLLWVSAEELGLYGSAAWCAAPDLPAGLVPVANVNLDMVGRNAPDFIELTPSPEHAAFNPLAASALELVALEGFDAPSFVDRDFARSDQASFWRSLGIPVVYLSTGEHADYHQPGDDPEKVDAHKAARVTRVALRLLERMQAAPLAPLAAPVDLDESDEPDGS